MHIYANYSKLTLYHALSHETQQPVGVIERENKNEGTRIIIIKWIQVIEMEHTSDQGTC